MEINDKNGQVTKNAFSWFIRIYYFSSNGLILTRKKNKEIKRLISLFFP